MIVALVLSGGIGSRLSSDIPKQYLKVCGKMIIEYTLRTLCGHEMIDAVQIVADESRVETIRSCMQANSKIKGFSSPGRNRQLSILNGLRDIRQYASDEDIVLIQDGVRPLTSVKLVTDTINAAKKCDGAVPVLPLKDTVYYSEDSRSLTRTLERAKILAGQAPEAFVLGKYLKANESLSKDEILKISGSAEPALIGGLNIAAVPGDEKNFKITTVEDLDRFRQIMEAE